MEREVQTTSLPTFSPKIKAVSFSLKLMGKQVNQHTNPAQQLPMTAEVYSLAKKISPSPLNLIVPS